MTSTGLAGRGRARSGDAKGGVAQGPLKRVGPSKQRGTTVTFWPDPAVFEETEFRAQTLATDPEDFQNFEAFSMAMVDLDYDGDLGFGCPDLRVEG